MKKILTGIAAVSALVAALALTGCSKKEGSSSTSAAKAPAFKVGVIYIGDENEGYTEAHMRGIQEMKNALGLPDSAIIEKKDIPEDEKCYDAAVDLAEQGCNYIIATSFGHESYLLQAAKEYPNIQFSHSTGFRAASSGLSNFHNFMPSVYESRFVSGVVAGMKLQEMIDSGKITAAEAKIGYVGAYPYAEVVSGYTSFFLGVRSICPVATMEVRYTNSWADMTLEKETAEALIADKCVLISQHADTTGAPTACQANGVPCVGYNVDMTTVAPDAALTSAALNWGAYYKLSAKAFMEGKTFDTDWSKGYSEAAVYITPVNTKVAAEGTQAKVDETIAAIKAGTLHPFNTASFSINGKTLPVLIKEDPENFGKYADYAKDGYFHEQELGSAPAFDLRIDGITELTSN